MQALLLSGDQLLSPHLPPSTAGSGKGDAVAGVREPTQNHFSLFLLFFFSSPLQIPVPSYTGRVKTAPCLPAQREGKCHVGKATFPLVLSLPCSCLAFPQGSRAGREDAAAALRLVSALSG